MFGVRIGRALGSALALFVFYAGTASGADTDAIKSPVATQCDILASHPHDYERVALPVKSIVNVAEARMVCEAALSRDPENPRLLFLMGRVLDQQEREYWELSAGTPYFERAAARGYLAAEFLLGVVNSKVWGRGRFRLAFFHMLRAARAGHLEAMGRISLFMGRRNAQKHRAEIIALTRKAIARGHADAMANLAKGYIFVLGDTERHEEAVDMLFEAEKRGSLEASAIIGQLQTFEAVPAGIRDLIAENTFGGLRRLLNAGEKGNRKAAFILGMLYSGTTFAIPRDRKKMITWLCRAGRRGEYMVAELLEKDVRKFRCSKELANLEKAG